MLGYIKVLRFSRCSINRYIPIKFARIFVENSVAFLELLALIVTLWQMSNDC